MILRCLEFLFDAAGCAFLFGCELSALTLVESTRTLFLPFRVPKFIILLILILNILK